MDKSYLNQNSLPRGLRNNNPGNLIYTAINWQGKLPYSDNKDWSGNPENIVRHFEQFRSLKYGIRAIALDAVNSIDPDTTLREYIYEYAPGSGDNQEAYINYVSESANINPNVPLDSVMNSDVLTALLLAQFDWELGSGGAGYVTESDIRDSIELLPDLILQELKQYVTDHPVITLGGVITVAGAGYTLYRMWKAKAA